MILKKSLSLLLCCLLLLLPITVSAAEITNDELLKLEQTFSELRNINNVLMQDSTQSQKDLIKALSLLRESQTELKKLQEQLIVLRAESQAAKEDLKKASDSLKEANQSFDQYAKEMKAKQNRLTWQRNIAIVGVFAALLVK